MQTNGKHTTERVRDFQLPPSFPETPKAQPLAKTEQAVSKIDAQFSLMQKKLELDQQRILGKVAALKGSIPVIEATFGEPNHNLQQLTNVILQRGCDCAEDIIEIVIEDEN